MNATRHAGMLEATRLTRAGQLLEATALIQRTLRGEPSPQRAGETASTPTSKPMTLDGECRVVDDEAAARPAHSGEQPDRASPERASRTSVEHTAAACSVVNKTLGKYVVDCLERMPILDFVDVSLNHRLVCLGIRFIHGELSLSECHVGGDSMFAEAIAELTGAGIRFGFSAVV